MFQISVKTLKNYTFFAFCKEDFEKMYKEGTGVVFIDEILFFIDESRKKL